MSDCTPTPEEIPNVFTTAQVARICKVATRTVSKWFDSGRLKGFRIPGSQDRRIPREYLTRFLNEHGMPLSNLTLWNTEPTPAPIDPRDSFDCTPQQYHAGLDKLWAALGLKGVQDDDVFTLAERELFRLRAIEAAYQRLHKIARTISTDRNYVVFVHDEYVMELRGALAELAALAAQNEGEYSRLRDIEAAADRLDNAVKALTDCYYAYQEGDDIAFVPDTGVMREVDDARYALAALAALNTALKEDGDA